MGEDDGAGDEHDDDDDDDDHTAGKGKVSAKLKARLLNSTHVSRVMQKDSTSAGFFSQEMLDPSTWMGIEISSDFCQRSDVDQKTPRKGIFCAQPSATGWNKIPLAFAGRVLLQPPQLVG